MHRGSDASTDTFCKVERLVSTINAKLTAMRQQLRSSEHHNDGHEEVLTDGHASTLELAKNNEMPELYDQAESSTSILFDGSASPQCSHHHHRSSSLYPEGDQTIQNAERNLFFAANDLCMFLNGGVDYRGMCLKYQETLDLLLRLIREDISMLHTVNVTTPDTVSDAVKVLRGLYTEAKALLERHGIVPDTQCQEGCVGTSPPYSPERVVPHGERLGAKVVRPGSRGSSGSSGGQAAHSRSGVEPHGRLTHGGATMRAARPAALVEGILSTGSNKQWFPPKHADTEKYSPLHFCDNKSKTETTQTSSAGAHATVVEAVDMDEAQTGSAEEARMLPRCAWETAAREGGRCESRRVALKAVYEQMFPNEGVDMLHEAMRLVVKEEHGCVLPESKGANSAELARRLLRCYVATSQRYYSLPDAVSDNATLPLSYIENCFQCNVPPTDGVLSLLSCISVEKRILKIALPSMHLRDDDLRPLLPLLSNLNQIITLDISNNKIGDVGAQLLCDSVLGHPTLRELNISDNPITDASADALLRLVMSSTQLVTVRQQGTLLSPCVCEAMERQLRRGNADCGADSPLPAVACGSGSSHPHPVVVLNGVGYKWQRATVGGCLRGPSPVSTSPLPSSYASQSGKKLGTRPSSSGTGGTRAQQGVRLPYIIAKGRREGNRSP